MDLDKISNRAYEVAAGNGFYDMRKRILRKMKNNNFDKEEIDYFNNILKTSDLMLVITEISEMVEALRSNNKDNFKEELSDTILRIITFTKDNNICIKNEVENKIEMNKKRGKLHGKVF